MVIVVLEEEKSECMRDQDLLNGSPIPTWRNKAIYFPLCNINSLTVPTVPVRIVTRSSIRPTDGEIEKVLLEVSFTYLAVMAGEGTIKFLPQKGGSTQLYLWDICFTQGHPLGCLWPN